MLVASLPVPLGCPWASCAPGAFSRKPTSAGRGEKKAINKGPDPAHPCCFQLPTPACAVGGIGGLLRESEGELDVCACSCRVRPRAAPGWDGQLCFPLLCSVCSLLVPWRSPGPELTPLEFPAALLGEALAAITSRCCSRCSSCKTSPVTPGCGTKPALGSSSFPHPAAEVHLGFC